jgi:pyridoxine/pyridoxamine 5'-phosphate oxidase
MRDGIGEAMAKRSEKHPLSEATQGEAMRIARGTQRPGQTKEQTKLIEQGIQKGIELYKKQQSAKARELDKKLKKARQQLAAPEVREFEVREKVVCKQHWLPWALLVVSWLAMAVYWLVN